MLRNIAVGIDASPASEVPLQQALQLAVSGSTRLHLITVREELVLGDEDLLELDTNPVLQADLPPEAASEEPSTVGIPPHLERARQLCHEQAVVCRLHVYSGAPWSCLQEKGQIAQVLVVGRSARRSPRAGRLGRTVRNLLRRPTVPLLVCGREPAGRRRGLVLYQPGPVGARTLALTAEICAILNLPLRIVAAASRREVAARGLRQAREVLYAYQIEAEFSAWAGGPAALAELSREHHPSLLALPAQSALFSFVLPPLYRAALSVPDAAVLVVP